MRRFEHNPLITPAMVLPSREDFEIIGTFNAGVTKYHDEIFMLLRVAERPLQHDQSIAAFPLLRCQGSQPYIEVIKVRKDDPDADCSDPRVVVYQGKTYTTSISHLRLARSKDGVTFVPDKTPTLSPLFSFEEMGIEDPRITCIEGVYWINYSAIAGTGITTALVSTCDWKTFERHGPIFCADNKDIALFPEKIGKKYFAFHRPTAPFAGCPAMWLAESPDMIHWGKHRHFMEPSSPGTWDDARIGCGGPPFLTDEGWIEIYHGANAAHRYCLGVVLLDKDYPDKILARSKKPLLEPTAPYEAEGFFGGVCFSCGQIVQNENVFVYYGAADEVMAGACFTIKELLACARS